MSNWAELMLSEMATIVTGATPRAEDPEHWGDEVDFVTPTDQIVGSRIAISSRKLSALGAAHFAKKIVPSGSTNLTCIGSIGKVSQCSRPCVTNQQINSLIAKSDVVDPDFLYYRILSWSPVLAGHATGSATPIVNKSTLAGYRFSVPPLNEQQAIADVLGSLDRKIAANNLVTLLALERARSLFKQSASLTSARQIQISDAVVLYPGKYIARDEYATGGSFRVFGSNSVMGSYNRYSHGGPVAVLAKIGSSCGRLRWSEANCWINNNACGLLPKTEADAGALRFALEGVDMSSLRQGSGQPFIDTKALMGTDIWLPSNPKPDFRDASRLEAARSTESDTLAELRDTLLPQLMSGALRVKDAEKQVEDVV